jgi:hypothetical protein
MVQLEILMVLPLEILVQLLVLVFLETSKVSLLVVLLRIWE